VPERILSISGLRGIVGDGLDPNFVVKFSQALGILADRGKVIVGRDGRASGQMLKFAVQSGLESVGCQVVDAGIISTPACGYLVRHQGAAAGLEITASHNPIQWNGLKPFSREGSVFDDAAGKRLLELLNAETLPLVPWEQLGSTTELANAGQAHVDRVCQLVDGPLIRKRRLKVVLDCNHGAGAAWGSKLLEALGCDATILGGTADGRFDHTPEPVKENLTGLCDAVVRQGADVGFAQDPDADRLAIVDNQGRYIGEELTLALCADYVLAEASGPVVVNGSTSRVTADIAAKHGCAFFRSHVGEANVVAKMREVGAIFGGEGNGGVIEPKVGYVRDSFVGMAYILAGLATRAASLAAWADSMPIYVIVKDKLTCPRDRADAACRALEIKYSDATASRGDGLRLDWSDRWVQVRASNTEPILRVIAEAPTQDVALSLCAEAIAVVRQAVGC
jgi:phosphomannomutase